jgi:hypothetical protein
MTITTLRIDTRLYFLDEEEDIPDLTKRILVSASGPPGFVTFTPTGLGALSVLITPHTSVQFEEQDSNDASDQREDDFSVPEFDANFDFDFESAHWA